MKKEICLILMCLVFSVTKGQDSIYLRVIKKQVLKTRNGNYNVDIYNKGSVNILNTNFNLPQVKIQDWEWFIQFSDPLTLRPDKALITDLVAKTINNNKNKLNIDKFKSGFSIDMLYFIDNKSYKLLYTNYFFDSNKVKDLTLVADLDKEFMTVADKIIIPPINYHLPAQLAHYGYVRSNCIVTWQMLKDKVKLD